MISSSISHVDWKFEWTVCLCLFFCIISCFSCKDFQILYCKYFLAVQYLHFICQKYFFLILIEVISVMDWSRKSGDSVYTSEFLAHNSRVPVDICCVCSLIKFTIWLTTYLFSIALRYSLGCSKARHLSLCILTLSSLAWSGEWLQQLGTCLTLSPSLCEHDLRTLAVIQQKLASCILHEFSGAKQRTDGKTDSCNVLTCLMSKS